jgi:hypothetical protein
MGWAKKIISIQADARAGKTAPDLEANAKQWATKTLKMLQANISKKGIAFNNELLESLEYRLVEGDNPSIVISFAAHGKYIDMKELFWQKAPPVDVLENWVRKVGVGYFNYVPGYKGVGDDVTGIPNAARRIAWAIAKNRASGEVVNQKGKFKRKRVWQNPTASKTGANNLGNAIGALRHLMAEAIQANIETMISSSITNDGGQS